MLPLLMRTVMRKQGGSWVQLMCLPLHCPWFLLALLCTAVSVETPESVPLSLVFLSKLSLPWESSEETPVPWLPCHPNSPTRKDDVLWESVLCSEKVFFFYNQSGPPWANPNSVHVGETYIWLTVLQSGKEFSFTASSYVSNSIPLPLSLFPGLCEVSIFTPPHPFCCDGLPVHRPRDHDLTP